jgi:ribosome biogenesis GTPase
MPPPLKLTLEDLGWDDELARALASLQETEPELRLEPARVLLAVGSALRVATADGEREASVAGRLRQKSVARSERPVVGDWVACETPADGTLRAKHVLPRRTKLSRKSAGRRTDEQVVAANIDTAIIVMGLDGDFNLRRLERLLTTVWESGARPVVLLNKLDLCEDPEARRAEVEEVALGAPVILASSLEGVGLDALRSHILPRQTAVLLGSSGVGKSTLINGLLGEPVQRVREVRSSDDRGRHTTTHRELFVLPGGGLLIDNPGVRELQLWGSESGLEQTFDDVMRLAEKCRFRDCQHESEPGCAVLEALRSGDLAESRLESFRKLQSELQYLKVRQDETAQQVEKQKWRTIHREMRRSGRHRRT